MFRRDKDNSRARKLAEQKLMPLKTVSRLDAHPIGHVPSGASATLHRGTWTLKGAGGHIANTRDVFYMFHSLPMTGDGAIVVRCDSVECRVERDAPWGTPAPSSNRTCSFPAYGSPCGTGFISFAPLRPSAPFHIDSDGCSSIWTSGFRRAAT